MSFIPGILAGIGALGGLFGNRPSTQQQNSTSNTSQNGISNFSNSNVSSTNPILSLQSKRLLTPITDQYIKMLGQDPDMSGYQANQIASINSGANANAERLQESAAARGISGPAVTSMLQQNDANRFSNITQLKNSIPLLALQTQLQKLGAASGFATSIPFGSESSSAQNGVSSSAANSNTNQTGQVTNPGNMLGGLFGNAGNILAYLYGQGAFGNNQNTGPSYGPGY